MDSKDTKIVCEHGAAIESMRRQQVVVTQLRAVVLPLLHAADGRSTELVVQLFDDVIGCNTSVVSGLQGCITGGGQPAELVIDGKSTVRTNHDMSHVEEQAKPNRVGPKRRRDGKISGSSLVTHVPHYDGYHWRKYGQKHINGTQHPRSYYRCAYRKENCMATKTIQQLEGNKSVATGDDDIAKYTVVYYGQHTCKGHSTFCFNMDLEINDEMAQANSLCVSREIEEYFGSRSDMDLAAFLEIEAFDQADMLNNWDDSEMC